LPFQQSKFCSSRTKTCFTGDRNRTSIACGRLLGDLGTLAYGWKVIIKLRFSLPWSRSLLDWNKLHFVGKVSPSSFRCSLLWCDISCSRFPADSWVMVSGACGSATTRLRADVGVTGQCSPIRAHYYEASGWCRSNGAMFSHMRALLRDLVALGWSRELKIRLRFSLPWSRSLLDWNELHFVGKGSPSSFRCSLLWCDISCSRFPADRWVMVDSWVTAP